MKILVVDDTPENLEAAKQTLSGHELTLVSNHEEFDELIQGTFVPESLSYIRPQFDAVLCDLLMPPSRRACGDKATGELMPVGYGMLLNALLYCGAKYAAVVTNTNHHDHPAAAQFDWLGNNGCDKRMKGANFTINGAKVAFVNTGSYGMLTLENVPCPRCKKRGASWEDKDYCKRRACKGLAKGKDWGRILKVLMGEDPATVYER